jgi:hypothetical protein
MQKFKVALKEVALFVVLTASMYGIIIFINYLRDQSYQWENLLLICILTVVFIRLFMFIDKVTGRKENKNES